MGKYFCSLSFSNKEYLKFSDEGKQFQAKAIGKYKHKVTRKIQITAGVVKV
jgi:hypothetical protein